MKLKYLTKRERQVFDACVGGLLDKEIAHTLDIKSETVKVHKHHIYKKLGLRNKAELAFIRGKQEAVSILELIALTEFAGDESVSRLVAKFKEKVENGLG